MALYMGVYGKNPGVEVHLVTCYSKRKAVMVYSSVISIPVQSLALSLYGRVDPGFFRQERYCVINTSRFLLEAATINAP